MVKKRRAFTMEELREMDRVAEWHIGDVRSFGGYYIYDEQGRLVAECPTVQGVDKLANANLIASAPELYEACKMLHQFNQQQHSGMRILPKQWAEAHQLTTKALAKAKGGESS